MQQYMQSTTEGYVWSIFNDKDRSGHVCASALECQRKQEDGFVSVIYGLLSARSVTASVAATRATSKAKAEATAALMRKLVEDGMAKPDSAFTAHA